MTSIRLAGTRYPLHMRWKPSGIRYLSTDTTGLRGKLRKKDFEYCVDLVQNRDRESYLCGLLMPYASRRSYFAIRAFNVELASIKDGSVSRKVGGAQFDESGASMALKIRVQWWHEALNQIYGNAAAEEPAKDDFLASMGNSCWNNPVVRVLDHGVHESDLTRRFLERLLEAREADLDIRQVDTMDNAMAYAESTFSSLLYLSLETTNVSNVGGAALLLMHWD
jgi:NADH dehydrogenase [ubiquinone] 1 alpha subcomplex assembly factor 6